VHNRRWPERYPAQRWYKIMARNYGLRRPGANRDRAPIWPLLVMTVIVVGVINAAMFLPHR
jgi:hypothetical protein